MQSYMNAVDMADYDAEVESSDSDDDVGVGDDGDGDGPIQGIWFDKRSAAPDRSFGSPANSELSFEYSTRSRPGTDDPSAAPVFDATAAASVLFGFTHTSTRGVNDSIPEESPPNTPFSSVNDTTEHDTSMTDDWDSDSCAECAFEPLQDSLTCVVRIGPSRRESDDYSIYSALDPPLTSAASSPATATVEHAVFGGKSSLVSSRDGPYGPSLRHTPVSTHAWS